MMQVLYALFSHMVYWCNRVVTTTSAISLMMAAVPSICDYYSYSIENSTFQFALIFYVVYSVYCFVCCIYRLCIHSVVGIDHIMVDVYRYLRRDP